jgi:hypothetical protein
VWFPAHLAEPSGVVVVASAAVPASPSMRNICTALLLPSPCSLPAIGVLSAFLMPAYSRVVWDDMSKIAWRNFLDAQWHVPCTLGSTDVYLGKERACAAASRQPSLPFTTTGLVIYPRVCPEDVACKYVLSIYFAQIAGRKAFGCAGSSQWLKSTSKHPFVAEMPRCCYVGECREVRCNQNTMSPKY